MSTRILILAALVLAQALWAFYYSKDDNMNRDDKAREYRRGARAAVLPLTLVGLGLILFVIVRSILS